MASVRVTDEPFQDSLWFICTASSRLSIYTSVENRMLCRLLSGVGIVSSCRKYSNTWTYNETPDVTQTCAQNETEMKRRSMIVT